MGVTRRGLLGAVVAAGLTGCVLRPDPRLNTSQTPWPRPDYWASAAAAEIALASVYITNSANTAPPGAANWCGGAADLHLAHAACLGQADPWGGYAPAATPSGVTALPPPGGGGLNGLQAAIDAARQAAETGLRAAPAGYEALLWASLVVCCAVDAAWCADPSVLRPAPVTGTALPSRDGPGPAPDAAAIALTHLDALAYALTTAIGRADPAGTLPAELSARLAGIGPLRNDLQAVIRAAGNTPTPPALTYALPGELGSDNDIRTTWGIMEANLGQSYTRLAGAQGGDQAIKTATQAADQLTRATALGQSLPWWPGWL